jgi:hypothetical protein
VAQTMEADLALPKAGPLGDAVESFPQVMELSVTDTPLCYRGGLSRSRLFRDAELAVRPLADARARSHSLGAGSSASASIVPGQARDLTSRGASGPLHPARVRWRRSGTQRGAYGTAALLSRRPAHLPERPSGSRRRRGSPRSRR